MTATTAVSAASPADATAARAVRASDDLADLLDRETAAVRALKLEGLDELIRAKASLLEAYEAEAKRLAEAGDDLVLLDATLAERLRGASDRLQRSAAANGRALEIARNAGSRIVEMIVECARRAQHGPSGYGANGRAAGGTRDAAVSLRLNQTL